MVRAQLCQFLEQRKRWKKKWFHRVKERDCAPAIWKQLLCIDVLRIYDETTFKVTVLIIWQKRWLGACSTKVHRNILSSCRSQQKLFANKDKSTTWPGAAGKNLHSSRVGKNEEAIPGLLQANPLPRPAQAQHHVRPVHQCQSHTVTWSVLPPIFYFFRDVACQPGVGQGGAVIQPACQDHLLHPKPSSQGLNSL